MAADYGRFIGAVKQPPGFDHIEGDAIPDHGILTPDMGQEDEWESMRRLRCRQLVIASDIRIYF